MTPEQMRELDRLLCERLGIEGDQEHDWDCDLETYDWGNPWRGEPPECTCTPTMNYPTLSTTGDGMLALMEALAKIGNYFALGHRDGLYDAAVSQAGKNSQVARSEYSSRALAVAAARSLGIEVPQ